VVVTPHAGLAVGHVLAGRHVVPAVGAVVDRVQYQPLVGGVGRQVRLVEQGRGDREPGLPVPPAVVAVDPQVVAQAQQPLGGDRGGGGVHRLVPVVRVGGPVPPVAEVDQSGGAGVPVRNAVAGGVREVEVG